jgi:hypothetical protein
MSLRAICLSACMISTSRLQISSGYWPQRGGPAHEVVDELIVEQDALHVDAQLLGFLVRRRRLAG